MGLGGAERVVVSLASGLRARGHEVAVSGAPGPLDAQLDGVRRLVLPERGRSPVGVMEWTAREAAFVRAWRPHVIHAHNAKATVIAAAAVRLGRGPRRPPLLATHHGAAAGRTGPRRRSCCCAPPTRSSSSPRACCDMFAPAVPRVIHNGIDPRRAGRHRTAARRRAVRRPPRAGQEPGPLPRGGRARPRGAASRSSATARCATQLHGPGVTFLGARDDARELLARAELLLVTSDSEGQSIAVLEALAAGTPVVSTPVSGMRELAGVRIASFDPDSTSPRPSASCCTIPCSGRRWEPRVKSSCASAFLPMSWSTPTFAPTASLVPYHQRLSAAQRAPRDPEQAAVRRDRRRHAHGRLQRRARARHAAEVRGDDDARADAEDRPHDRADQRDRPDRAAEHLRRDRQVAREPLARAADPRPPAAGRGRHLDRRRHRHPAHLRLGRATPTEAADTARAAAQAF